MLACWHAAFRHTSDNRGVHVKVMLHEASTRGGGGDDFLGDVDLDYGNKYGYVICPQVAIYGIGRLLRPRPTCRALWMSVLLLWGAAAIILPIIRAEGLRAVFAPGLVRKPTAMAHITRPNR